MNPQPELFVAAPQDDEAEVQSLAEARREREEQLKRDVLRRMKRERREWLDKMEAELAKVCEYRVTTWGEDEAYVTADDGRSLMKAYPARFALPAGASANTMGALFHGKAWQPVDVDSEGRAVPFHVSTTEGSHGNRIVRWRYVGQRGSAAA